MGNGNLVQSDLFRTLCDEFAKPVLEEQDILARARRQTAIHRLAFAQETDDAKLGVFSRILVTRIKHLTEQLKPPDSEAGGGGGQKDFFDTNKLAPEAGTGNAFHYLSECFLAWLQLHEISAVRGFDRTRHILNEFRQMPSASPWVEEQVLGEETGAPKATFLLSIRLGQLMRGTRAHQLLPIGLARRALDEATRGMEGGKENGFLSGAFAGEDILESFNLRDSLAQMVHEICENAMSHGVASEINQNRHSEPADFGRVFVFQASKKMLTNKSVLGENQNFPGLKDFHAYHIEKRQARASNNTAQLMQDTQDLPEAKVSDRKQYLIYSFLDTGMGIERHLEKYGNVPDGSLPSIGKIAQEHMSARTLHGSGHGLQNMFKLANKLKAFLAFTTSQGTFTYNGITEQQGLQPDSGLSRGTLISLYLPVRA